MPDSAVRRPPPLPADVWASPCDVEGKGEPPAPPSVPSPPVPSLSSRPPHVFRRPRHGSTPTPPSRGADQTSCKAKTPLSAPMDDLQTRLREKLHSKLDGGSLLSPLTVLP
jgi:hypothetical protein